MTQTSAYPARSSDAAAVGPRAGTLLRSGLTRLQPWSDWIVFVVTAAALYPMFGRSSDMGPFYSAAARCVLNGESLLSCLPQYPYQAALAVFFIPLAFLPPVLQRLIWYVIFVGCLVIVVRLTEAIAERLYPGSTRGQNLFWLRTIMLVSCGKHFLDVVTYASHDPLSLALIMLGTWALFNGREAAGGAWLAVSAAIRASPLIYLPYLILKRRLVACLAFIVVLLAVSLIPDIIGALRGGNTGHLTEWFGQVVGPALVPGNSSKLVFWDIWNGANLYNQSLRDGSGLWPNPDHDPDRGRCRVCRDHGRASADITASEGVRRHRHGGAPDRDVGAVANDQPLSLHFCASRRHSGDRGDHDRSSRPHFGHLCAGCELLAAGGHFQRSCRPADY